MAARTLLLAVAALTAPSFAAEPTYPPPKSLSGFSGGRNVQRTMRLLAESTPERRNTVRILFYGQSITEQGWWKAVADDLRRRFPHAELVIENRAIGGHASQLLVKTAEADLYPFQPDLVVFHVYGSHDKYEEILRGVRERTTAEILQQNDHVTKEADLTEETDAAKLPPAGTHWDAFMNQNWLPSLSRRYETEFCDQRSHWKRYLADNGLKPADLLRDGVHLNEHGEFLMAEIVKEHLRRDPSLDPSPAEAWVKTYEAGKDIRWENGKLRLDFAGTRVVAVCKPGEAPPASVRIDGKPPSEHPGCYAFTRASAYPGMNWPCLLRVSSRSPLVAEEWTATLREISDDGTSFRFAVRGSVTGDDGEGTSTESFASKSGRIAIEPDDWNLAYARRVKRSFAPNDPAPTDGFEVRWDALFLGADEFTSPGIADPAVEATVTLAQGLPNGRHVLEIAGDERTPIATIRVYSPPLK